jgi:hypothetical protein
MRWNRDAIAFAHVHHHIPNLLDNPERFVANHHGLGAA